MLNILAIIKIYTFYIVLCTHYTIGSTSFADPSKLQSHSICTVINLFNTLFHSVTITIGSLSESIYLIPVSNSLLVDVGVKVPSLCSKLLT